MPSKGIRNSLKRIIAFFAAVLIAASMIGLAACRHGGGDDTPNTTDVPVITQSPDGQVTAGPTATPIATPVPTNVPVITMSPGGEVTAGPTATPEATPVPTDVPVITMSPGGEVTAGPTATPVAAPTSSPAVTNTPAPTPAPTAPTPTAPGGTSTPTPAVPTPSAPNSLAVTYAGENVDCSSLKVGDTFRWCLLLDSENSALAAGLWLVDYDERYVKPIGYSVTWEGGLVYMIEDAWENGDTSSDKPDLFVNMEYEGATGPNPYGESGNMYSIVGLFLTTGGHGGVNMRGPMVRLTFEVIAIPKTVEMQHDAGGYYLPVGIVVIESTALDGSSPVTHGSITAESGRMYFKH